jgi:hypothetical protein
MKLRTVMAPPLVVLTLGLTACGGDGEGRSSTEGGSSSATTPKASGNAVDHLALGPDRHFPRPSPAPDATPTRRDVPAPVRLIGGGFQPYFPATGIEGNRRASATFRFKFQALEKQAAAGSSLLKMGPFAATY